MKLKILIISLACLALVADGISQERSGRNVKIFESERWVMPDSAPLIFKEESPSGFISIEVRTGKVAGYQFGCIEIQNGKFTTVKKLNALRINLEKEEPILSSYILNMSAVKDCNAPSKLGIVAVDFQDGGKWSLPEAAKDSH